MADIQWIKITVDMFDNRKIKHLRRLPEGNSIVLIWVMLLTMAGRCNAGGMIFLTENICYTPKMLADELGFEENTVRLALDALEKLGMVSTVGNTLWIEGWEEHQNAESLEKIREQTRLRVAKHREKQAQLAECNATRNVTVTQSNATEIEEDKDKDIEIEKERKENIKRKERNTCTQPQGDCVLQLPLVDGSLYDVPRKDVDQWSHLYPAVDVMQELRNMLGWLDASPAKRKTRTGIRRFINNWLSKTQNSGGTRGYTGTASPQEPAPAPHVRRRATLDELVEYPPGSGKYRPEWEVPNN